MPLLLFVYLFSIKTFFEVKHSHCVLLKMTGMNVKEFYLLLYVIALRTFTLLYWYSLCCDSEWF